jgi:uncharacterized membrane protein (UPF0127 family)
LSRHRRVAIGLAIAGALLVAGGIAIVLAGGGDDETVRTALGGFGTVAVTIDPGSGPARETCMLAARTDQQRARGLMEVTDPTLGGHDGMVFLYGEDTSGEFWMRNTPLPLSIAFVDARGRIVSTADMAPCGDSPDCPLHAAAGPYRYAVEVPRGRLDDLGLTGSARMRVGGACR